MQSTLFEGCKSDMSKWAWGFGLGNSGPLFLKEIDKKRVENVSDFRSLCALIYFIRSGKESIDEQFQLLDFQGLNESIRGFTDYVRTHLNKPDFDFYMHLLPLILGWAVTVEEDYVKNLPLLEKGIESTSVLSSRQIRHILANAFILNVGEFSAHRHFGNISFETLFEASSSVSVNRLLCQIAYFYRVAEAPQRQIAFSRFNLKEDPMNEGELEKKVLGDGGREVVIHTNRMEISGEDYVFFDFANRDIHIHLIIPSATQEEVLFSCCPEALVSILFCERMLDNEGIIISGTVRFADYTGYQSSFRFSGFFEDPPLKKCDILVLDAAVGAREQFRDQGLRRDLKKAYLGFKECASLLDKPKIATGHWGCGAFGGHPTLKFLQQTMAATMANVDLHYSTFKEDHTASQFRELWSLIKEKRCTVRHLFDLISCWSKIGDFNEYISSSLSTIPS